MTDHGKLAGIVQGVLCREGWRNRDSRAGRGRRYRQRRQPAGARAEALEERRLLSLYSITDLGTGGAFGSAAHGLNDAGQVVGELLTTSAATPTSPGQFQYNGPSDPFVWTPSGGMQDLGSPSPAINGVAYGINNSGQIVGQGSYYSGEFPHPGGFFTQLGAGPLSTASIVLYSGFPPSGLFAVDNSIYAEPPNLYGGLAVGQYAFDASQTLLHAAFYNGQGNAGAVNQDLYDQDGGDAFQSAAYGLSDIGPSALVGSVGEFTLGNGHVHAFFEQNTAPYSLQDIGQLTGYEGDSAALATNGNGTEVVGYAPFPASNGGREAFIYDAASNQITYFGNISGRPEGKADAVNNEGVCVGTMYYNPGDGDPSHIQYSAFIRYPSSFPRDLNTLVLAGSGWTLEEATGINNNGQICGYGLLNGQTHAFLLTLTPPVVTNTSTSGPGSLQQAIQTLDASPGGGAISFYIPATDPGYNPTTGVFTIANSTLPIITQPITIDGATEPSGTIAVSSVLEVGSGTSATISDIAFVAPGRLQADAGSNLTLSAVTLTTLSFTGGSVTVNGPVNAARILISSGDITFNSTVITRNLDVSGGILDGPGSVTVTNAGTLSGGVLSGTGSFNVAPGATVNVTGNVLSNRLLVIGAGASPLLRAAPSTAPTPDGLIDENVPGVTFTADGGILFAGMGNPTLQIDAGDVLMLRSQVQFSGTGEGYIVGGGTIDLGGMARTFTVYGVAQSADLSVQVPLTDGSIGLNGPGRMQLTGPSSYVGGTTLGAGTLEIDDPGALGAGVILLSNATLALGPQVTVLANTLSGINENGTLGTMSLDIGAGTCHVKTLILGAALNVAGTGQLIVDAAVTLPSQSQSTSPVTINNAAASVTINGRISGGVGLTKTLGGLLTFAGGMSNTYSGPTEIDGGTLVLAKVRSSVAVPGNLLIVAPGAVQFRQSNQLPSTGLISFDHTLGAPALNLSGFSQTLAGIAGMIGAKLDLAGGTLSLAYGNGADPNVAVASAVYQQNIFSSTLLSGQAVGYLDNPTTHTELIRVARLGDFNLDGKVNNADYFQFNKSFGKTRGQAGFNPLCDFNRDGIVSNADYFQFNKNFGQ